MMTQLFGRPPIDTDPATPANRLTLARKLLLGAIRRYEETCLEWNATHESFPPLARPRQPSGPEEVEQRRLWRALLDHADENFDNAERNLAERIHGLFAMIDPAGRCAPLFDGAAYFTPRAVRHDGNVYVLAYSAWEYEPKTNVIAVYRNDLVMDLDGDAPVHGETTGVGSR